MDAIKNIITSVIAAAIMSIGTFFVVAALKTDKQEDVIRVMSERIDRLDQRLTTADRAQSGFEARLVRLEVNIDRIGTDVREIKGDIKGLTPWGRLPANRRE